MSVMARRQHGAIAGADALREALDVKSGEGEPCCLVFHQQSQSATRMRLGRGRAHKGQHRLAVGHAAGYGRSLSQNLFLRRFVGVALVDRGQQINAVGELARNAILHGLAGADALHDEVGALEGMERERPMSLALPPMGM